jgi:hypothetical protein
VILAVIAVITVPIIVSIIEDSKKSAAKDSAYGYIDGINKFYVSKLYQNKDYVIPNKSYTVTALKDIGVSVSGKEPIGNSWVTIQNNNVVQGCLQFDEYKIDIVDGVLSDSSKSECDELVVFNGTYVLSNSSDTHKGVVYLDPTNISNECSATVGYSDAQSVPGVTSGCMKFYIFKEYEKENVTYVNMILDHNTSSGKAWTLYTSGGNKYVNYNGPREALYQLYEDTKNWNGIKQLSSSDNYTPSLMYDNNAAYTIDYTKNLNSSTSYDYSSVSSAYRARFITAEEVAEIVEKENFSIGSGWFYLDSKDSSTRRSSSNPSDYAWLFENLNYCQQYGCIKQSDVTGNVGYWTASSYSGNATTAWNVYYYGMLYNNVIQQNSYGIRPVIELPKSVLESN